ncbi:UPF0481 protein [Nymphaea thermarum]|nr:UPF0481 protein [Nymphaea thermarum]
MAEERNPLPPPPPPPLGSEHMGTVAVLPTAANIQSAVASTDVYCFITSLISSSNNSLLWLPIEDVSYNFSILAFGILPLLWLFLYMATMGHINTTTMAEEKKKDKEIWPAWVVDIEEEYESYDPSEYELKLKKKCIYKWPTDLNITSSMSMHRTPHLASLGPYHHGEEHLQPMEHHKKRALYRILRRSGVSLHSFLDSLKGIEQELRDSYDNLDPKLPTDSFLRMMLLDGCFIIELLCSVKEDSSDKYEPIFSTKGKLIETVFSRDMLLLENQIPLLVLRKLVEVGKLCDVNSDDLNQMISQIDRSNFPFHANMYIQLISQIYGLNQMDGHSSHILDIYRKCLIMDNTMEEQTTSYVEGFIKSVCLRYEPWLHVIGKGIKRMLLAIPILVFRILGKQISKPGNMRSAMRFHEAGVVFKKAKPCSGLKIAFDEEHGVLTLPFIDIDDNTAAIYMNLMAFERMHPQLTGNYVVTSYASFMDDLIDTVEDVSLLCSRGIAKNHLGSDEDAANVFNKLGDGITDCQDLELYAQLQSYVASDWNAARAHLKQTTSKTHGLFCLYLLPSSC